MDYIPNSDIDVQTCHLFTIASDSSQVLLPSIQHLVRDYVRFHMKACNLGDPSSFIKFLAGPSGMDHPD